MSFIEVLTWIKEGVDHAWKGWVMKHLDWGPNTSAPYASIRSDEIMATPGANIRVPHGLHVSQLEEDMVVLQFGR
jgi:hypothetical protein